MIHLVTLGRLDARGQDGQLLAGLLAQPKRLALLVYLATALPRGFHQRDKLLDLFWPDADQARASRSLRQALHFLRRSLPEGVLVTRGPLQVGVDPAALTCDAVAFDEAVDFGREEDALQRYCGEFLPAFHVSGAPDFTRWMELERERLRRRAVRSALLLAHRAAESGNAPAAEKWAERAAEIAPDDIGALQQGATAVAHAATAAAPPAASAAKQHSGALEPVARHPALRNPGASSPRNLEALHAYLRGRSASRHRTAAATLEAIRHYREALRLQPTLAEAHVGLAEAWVVLPVYAGYAAADALPQAKHHAAKAVALEPTLAAAHALLAHAIVCYEWDWDAAGKAFDRALQLDPASVDVRTSYALYYLAPTGRFEEAIRSMEIARDFDPTSPVITAYVGMCCYYGRQNERAIAETRLALELNSSLPLGWWVLGMAQEQVGDMDGAMQSFERAVELTDASSLMLAQLARARAATGDRRGAEELLATIVGRDEEHGPALYFTAAVHAALGDAATALAWLERAYRERNPHVVFIGVAPPMDPLRGERRFRELMLRIGLGGLRSRS